MLTTPEKIVFLLMALTFGGLTAAGFYRMYRVVRRGRPAPPLKGLLPKAVKTLLEIGLQLPIFRARPILSTFHAFIFFGFSYYFLVNFNDVLEGFVPGYSTAEVAGRVMGLLNLAADLLSIGVLVGMVVFLVRRFLAQDKRLNFGPNVLLQPGVAAGGVKRDSLVVGGFILFHVGSRFTGQALRLALMGVTNPMQPFASLLSQAFRGMSPAALTTAIHATWWLAIGLIVLFLPYFVISKHVHLMVAPLNLILAKQNPRGQLDPAALPALVPAPTAGAAILTDLAWPRLLDGYACIMCNRCQDVCPAAVTGRPLSPSALEINKRYYMNRHLAGLSGGSLTPAPLLGTVISPEAVWACTTCYACVQACPVGNEPMADIVDIRRRMILETPGELDSGVQSTLEAIARTGNSFGKPARKRAAWAREGLEVKVKDIRKEPAEYLWFVGDTASLDPRAVPNTQQVARVFQQAGVDFGILYEAEKNTGNDVRRVGEEGLFEMLVEDNLKAMGGTEFSRIITTDPHSLNTLRNEYPQYGGKWPVHHYTGLLLELIESGKLQFGRKLGHYLATYHDPCYLGRYNGGFAAPRKIIQLLGLDFREMPRNKENSFCCGAGGGQIWMGSTPPGERPAENRIREALRALEGAASPDGAGPRKLLFVVACPKDVVMYTDAVKTSGNEGKIEVVDIIQLVAEATQNPESSNH